jgi:hypothetical protein
MSIVCYVLCPRAPDAATWTELGTTLRADGFAPQFDPDPCGSRVPIALGPSTPQPDARSISLISNGATVLLNVESTASNEALSERFPELAAGLRSRPISLFLEACGDAPLDLWNALAACLAELLDGWIYSETTDELTGPHGEPVGDDEPSGGEGDEEVAIDWSSLPHPSLRPFAIVLRWDRQPSLYRLDELLQSVDDRLRRNASYDGRTRLPDSDRWHKASYLGALGEVVELERQSDGNYVRVVFDLDESLVERDAGEMAKLVGLAQRVLEVFRAAVSATPIDVEPC